MPDDRRPDIHELDDLIAGRLRAAAARETPPPALLSAIERRLAARSRRRAALRLAGAMAAALLVAITLWTVAGPASVPDAAPDPVARPSAPSAPNGSSGPGGSGAAVARAPRPVTVEPGPGLLARRVETVNADVTVVLLYRDLTAPADAAASPPSDPERNET